MPRDTIEVRCPAHPPTEGRWTRFGGVHEYGKDDEREEELGDWYVRYVGDPVLLERAHLLMRARSLEFYVTGSGSEWTVPAHILGPLSATPVYGIGFDGDIVPNCGWDTETVLEFCADGEPTVVSHLSADELEAKQRREVEVLVPLVRELAGEYAEKAADG